MSNQINSPARSTVIATPKSRLGLSLRRFLGLGTLLPVLAAMALSAFAGNGSIVEVTKHLTTEYISCRVQYFGPATSILGRATVDGRGVGEPITHHVTNGQIVQFRFYGDLRRPNAGIINLRSPETGTVLVRVP